MPACQNRTRRRRALLRSASELFGVIKKSLQRCSKFVSRGEPMLLLMGAFQVLKGLARMCLHHLPSGNKEGALGAHHTLYPMDGFPEDLELEGPERHPTFTCTGIMQTVFCAMKLAVSCGPQRVLHAYAARLIVRLPKTACGRDHRHRRGRHRGLVRFPPQGACIRLDSGHTVVLSSRPRHGVYIVTPYIYQVFQLHDKLPACLPSM